MYLGKGAREKRQSKRLSVGKKSRITITIDDDLLEWLDRNVDSKYFANRSHGFEFLIKRKMDDKGANNAINEKANSASMKRKRGVER